MTITRNICSFLTASMMIFGIGIGGMLDPRQNSAFFDLYNVGTLYWIPTIVLLFLVTLIFAIIGYDLIKRYFSKPFFVDKFHIPTRRDLTPRLFIGMIMFGIGWGLCGYCPGPAIAHCVTFDKRALIVTLGLFCGFAAFKIMDSRNRYKMKLMSNLSYLLIIITITTLMNTVGKNPGPLKVIDMEIGIMRIVIGGFLIALSVLGLLITVGEIMGIAGIVNGLCTPAGTDRPFRWSFLFGLLFAAKILDIYDPNLISIETNRNNVLLGVGGFLVGYGTSLGSGCTSGHGISGNMRLSRRSLYATATFFIFNMITTTLLRGIFNIGVDWHSTAFHSPIEIV